MSVLRYWAHLLPVPPALMARERVWHTRVLGAPYNSITADVVSLVMGKRCRFYRLSDVAFVSSATYVARTSLLDGLAEEWHAAACSPEVALARYGDDPPENSLLARALTTRSGLRGSPTLKQMWDDGADAAKLFDALVEERGDTKAVDALRRRLQSWGIPLGAAEVAAWARRLGVGMPRAYRFNIVLSL